VKRFTQFLDRHRIDFLMTFGLFEALFLLSFWALSSGELSNSPLGHEVEYRVYWFSLIALVPLCVLIRRVAYPLSIFGWLSLIGSIWLSLIKAGHG